MAVVHHPCLTVRAAAAAAAGALHWAGSTGAVMSILEAVLLWLVVVVPLAIAAMLTVH
jgi:hypothetical protein